jgi:hypothetical protein
MEDDYTQIEEDYDTTTATDVDDPTEDAINALIRQADPLSKSLYDKYVDEEIQVAEDYLANMFAPGAKLSVDQYSHVAELGLAQRTALTVEKPLSEPAIAALRVCAGLSPVDRTAVSKVLRGNINVPGIVILPRALAASFHSIAPTSNEYGQFATTTINNASTVTLRNKSGSTIGYGPDGSLFVDGISVAEVKDPAQLYPMQYTAGNTFLCITNEKLGKRSKENVYKFTPPKCTLLTALVPDLPTKAMLAAFRPMLAYCEVAKRYKLIDTNIRLPASKLSLSEIEVQRKAGLAAIYKAAASPSFGVTFTNATLVSLREFRASLPELAKDYRHVGMFTTSGLSAEHKWNMARKLFDMLYGVEDKSFHYAIGHSKTNNWAKAVADFQFAEKTYSDGLEQAAVIFSDVYTSTKEVDLLDPDDQENQPNNTDQKDGWNRQLSVHTAFVKLLTAARDAERSLTIVTKMHPTVINEGAIIYPLYMYTGFYFTDFSKAPASMLIDGYDDESFPKSDLMDGKNLYGPRPHNMEKIVCMSTHPPVNPSATLRSILLMAKGRQPPKNLGTVVLAKPVAAVATIFTNAAKKLTLKANLVRNFLLLSGLPILPDSSFSPTFIDLDRRNNVGEANDEDQAEDNGEDEDEAAKAIRQIAERATTRQSQAFKDKKAADQDRRKKAKQSKGLAQLLPSSHVPASNADKLIEMFS